MTNDEKLTLAREALEDIKNPIEAMRRAVPDGYRFEGGMALHMANDPEWYKRCAERALEAIATESAPAAGAASIDTPVFARLANAWADALFTYEDSENSYVVKAWADLVTHVNAVLTGQAYQHNTPSAVSADTKELRRLMSDYALGRHRGGDVAEALIAHINAYAAQQREAGRQEVQARYDESKRVDALCFESERKRADRAVAELEEWRFTNKIDELQRAHDALLVRAQTAEAALAQQHEAGKLEGFKKGVKEGITATYVLDPTDADNPDNGGTIIEVGKPRKLKTKLAARAVGGVDDWREQVSRLVLAAHNAEQSPTPKFMSILRERAVGVADLLKGRAPVGDGDERWWTDAELESLLISVISAAAESRSDAYNKLRAALTKQKGR